MTCTFYRVLIVCREKYWFCPSSPLVAHFDALPTHATHSHRPHCHPVAFTKCALRKDFSFWYVGRRWWLLAAARRFLFLHFPTKRWSICSVAANCSSSGQCVHDTRHQCVVNGRSKGGDEGAYCADEDLAERWSKALTRRFYSTNTKFEEKQTFFQAAVWCGLGMEMIGRRLSWAWAWQNLQDI